MFEVNGVRLGGERAGYMKLSVEIYALAELARHRYLRCHNSQCWAVTAKYSTKNFFRRLENYSDTYMKKISSLELYPFRFLDDIIRISPVL